MAVKFHSSGDALLTYCTVFSMYITLWNMERQSDTLLLLLYYSDLFYFAQYACVKLSKAWSAFNDGILGQSLDRIEAEGEITLGDSLPLFTTPISLLPFHVVFKIGLDRGCFYQFVCFLRLLSLYQDGRINIDWQKNTRTQQGSASTQLTVTHQPHHISVPQELTVQMDCQCKCRVSEKEKIQTCSHI